MTSFVREALNRRGASAVYLRQAVYAGLGTTQDLIERPAGTKETSAMLISSRLAVPAVIVFALVATNGPLTAQLSTPARAKPLATPLPGPDTGSLKWLLGKPADDAAKRDSPPPAFCALQQCDAAVYCFPGTNSACLIQTFPDIQWRICIQASAYGTTANQHSRGISIGPVDIRRNLAPATLWQRVIYRAEVAENTTPYHDGEHLSDDQFANWTNWREPVTSADANGGALITLSLQKSACHLRPEGFCNGPCLRKLRQCGTSLRVRSRGRRFESSKRPAVKAFTEFIRFSLCNWKVDTGCIT